MRRRRERGQGTREMQAGRTGGEDRLPGEAPDLEGPGGESPLPPRLTLCSLGSTLPHPDLPCPTSAHISERNPNQLGIESGWGHGAGETCLQDPPHIQAGGPPGAQLPWENR